MTTERQPERIPESQPVTLEQQIWRLTGAYEHLATKSDISQVEGELRLEISRVEGELKADNARLEGELKADNARLEGELKAEIARVDGELKADMKDLENRLFVRLGMLIIATGAAVAILQRLW